MSITLISVDEAAVAVVVVVGVTVEESEDLGDVIDEEPTIVSFSATTSCDSELDRFLLFLELVELLLSSELGLSAAEVNADGPVVLLDELWRDLLLPLLFEEVCTSRDLVEMRKTRLPEDLGDVATAEVA